MEKNSNKNPETIWKDKPVFYDQRKTSSGCTFGGEYVKKEIEVNDGKW